MNKTNLQTVGLTHPKRILPKDIIFSDCGDMVIMEARDSFQVSYYRSEKPN